MKNIITTSGYILEISKDDIKNGDWILDVGITKNEIKKAEVDTSLGVFTSGNPFKIIAHKPLNNNPLLKECKIIK